MRAPDFWWQPRPNLIARLLAPLGSVYGAVTTQGMKHAGLRAPIPVFCVGNFVAGGAGKTPTAIAIGRRLQAQGETPVFLSRGYRGSAGRGPLLVDRATHLAKDVGDEALLLARIAPTVVGSDRIAAAALAREIGASLVILDDGLQNASLVQDLRLAAVDGIVGIGNGLCVPAGPLRAPLAGQLASVSAVLFIGEGLAAARWAKTAGTLSKPVFNAHFVAEKAMASRLAGKPVVAFAGIGLPQKFKSSLLDMGAKIAGWRDFPDHHVYSTRALRALQGEAAQKQASLVTTEKDFVRIAPLLGKLDPNLPLPQSLPVELVFGDPGAFDNFLRKALSAARRRSSLAG